MTDHWAAMCRAARAGTATSRFGSRRLSGRGRDARLAHCVPAGSGDVVVRGPGARCRGTADVCPIVRCEERDGAHEVVAADVLAQRGSLLAAASTVLAAASTVLAAASTVLAAASTVLAAVDPALVVSSHAQITDPTRVYAGYLSSRDAAIAIALIVALALRRHRLLGAALAWAALTQFLDVAGAVTGRWALPPGLILRTALLAATSSRLSGARWSGARGLPDVSL